MSTGRKKIAKSIRFEVFKRDKFTCQYCGAKAPDVALHVIDHVHPVSKGGGNEPLNLITACEPCNAGKSDRTLDDSTVLERQRQQLEDLQERREQLEMMVEWQQGLLALGEHAVDQVCAFYTSATGGWSIKDEDARGAIRAAIRRLSMHVVLEELRGCVEKYLRLDDADAATEDAARIIAETFLRRLKYRALEDRDPVGSHLLYTRGILRRRVSYCNDRLAIEMLRDAHAAGVSLDDLRALALETQNWSAWKDAMHSLVAAAEGTGDAGGDGTP